MSKFWHFIGGGVGAWAVFNFCLFKVKTSGELLEFPLEGKFQFRTLSSSLKHLNNCDARTVVSPCDWQLCLYMQVEQVHKDFFPRGKVDRSQWCSVWKQAN